MRRFTAGVAVLAVVVLTGNVKGATSDSFEVDNNNAGDIAVGGATVAAQLRNASAASRAAAKPLVNGSTQTHNLHIGGTFAGGADRDFVTFTLSASSDILIQTDLDIGPADTVIRLYSNAGVELANDDDGNPAGNNLSRLFLTEVPAGTYFLSVEEFRIVSNNARTIESYKLSFLSAPTGQKLAPLLTTRSSVPGAVGGNFNLFVNVLGSSPVFVQAQGLPPGLQLAGTTIVGVPTQPGTFNATLTAQNGTPPNSTRPITFVITDFGVITSLAGDGNARLSGDGGPGTKASLNGPSGVCADPQGNVFVADTQNHVVRRVEASTGYIFPVAGTNIAGNSGNGAQATNARLDTPTDVALDSTGNLYITDTGNAVIRRVTSAGIISQFAAVGTTPSGICVDPSGNLYVTDTTQHRVFKVTSAGVVSNFAGTGTAGNNGTSGTATALQLNTPTDVASDAGGNIFIADSLNFRVCRVTPAGVLSVIAGTGTGGFSGDGGPATSAQLSVVSGVAVDAQNNVYISDKSVSRIRRVTGTTIDTLAGGGPTNTALTDNGAASTDGSAALAAVINEPGRIDVDRNGGLYLVDVTNVHRLRKVALATVPAITSATTATGTKDSPFNPPLRLTATGFPFPTFTATGLPAGLALRDGQIIGVPTVSGVADVTLTAANSRGVSNSTLRITLGGVTGTLGLSDGTSAAIIASPNPSKVNGTVTFVAPSVTSGGDLRSFTWDFGDPLDTTPGRGETATHKYTAAGVYTVKLTVTDGVTTLTLSYTQAVNATDVTEDVIISKTLFKLNFADSNKDQIQVGGIVPFRNTKTVSGTEFKLSIGSISKTYTLDDKGKGTGSGGKNDVLKLRADPEDSAIDTAGLFVSGKFSVLIRFDTFSDDLASLGFVASVATPKPVKVPILITVNGDSYLETVTIVYKSTEKVGTGVKLKEGGSIPTR